MKTNCLFRTGRSMAIAAAITSVAVLAGCAHESASSSVYTYGQAQREQVVRLGTVQSVRTVNIQQARTSGVGMAAGGALGGVAGSTIGGGTGRTLAAITGGLLGAYVGDQVEHVAHNTRGLEIVVLLDNGETRVVAQADDVQIGVGQRVRMISGGGPVRVVPMY